MTGNEASGLLEKYLSGQCTESEKALVETWYLNFEHQNLSKLSKEQWEQLATSVPPVKGKSVVILPMLKKWTAAASILILGVTSIILFRWHQGSPAGLVKIVDHDVKAGRNQASLALSDGRTIFLDGTTKGSLLNSADLKIIQKDGEVIYSVKAGHGSGKAVYHTITTPKGGQWQVVLPDHTHVWLNAASSLKYPAQFAGTDRTVELTGEGYFEVTKNPAKPFFVRSGNQTIKVLGTHFNVQAYSEDEAITSTLLEGSIQLKTVDNTTRTLKPGEEAVNKNGGQQLMLKKVDTEVAIAWKNGTFMFEHEQLGSIMRKICRWYNMEVAYNDVLLPRKVFSGSISKFDNVSEVLRMLAVTGKIHFDVQNNKIIISNK